MKTTRTSVGPPPHLPCLPPLQKVLLSSIVFIFASIFLTAEFVVLYYGAGQAIYYGGSPAAWASTALCAYLGAANTVLWVLGFVLLIDREAQLVLVAMPPQEAYTPSQKSAVRHLAAWHLLQAAHAKLD